MDRTARLTAHFRHNAPFLRSISIYMATAALTAGAPLLLIPLLTRILTPEQYGKLAMFSAAAQISGVAVGLSTHGAVGMRYFDRDKIDFPGYVTTCLLILLVSAALSSLFVWVTLPRLENLTKLPGAWLFAAVLCSAAGSIVQIQLSIWQSSKAAAKFCALRVFHGANDLGASLLFVLAFGLAWQGRASGIVFGAVAASAYALFSLKRGNWLRLPKDTVYARSALAFGLPLVPHAAGGILVMTSDRLLITNTLDISFTGLYLVASQLGMAFNLASDALHRAYSPCLIEELKRRDLEHDKKIVQRTYFYFLGLLLVGLAFGALAPIALGVLAGPKFQLPGSVFMFIALGQAFSGMYLMVATYIFYAGRTTYLAVLTITMGVANLAITYWLLTLHGLVGAAEAFMVIQLLFFLGAWALAHHCRPMPWLEAINIEPQLYLKALAIGIIMLGYASFFVPSAAWVLPSKARHASQLETQELIDASRAGNLGQIIRLLSYGADVNAANKLGITPLIAASAALQVPAVELLLSHRADKSAKTAEGFTAYDFAKNQLNGDLAKLLTVTDEQR